MLTFKGHGNFYSELTCSSAVLLSSRFSIMCSKLRDVDVMVCCHPSGVCSV